jgi:hypothetical protein
MQEAEDSPLLETVAKKQLLEGLAGAVVIWECGD